VQRALSPLRGEKPKNRPVSIKTISADLRFALSVGNKQDVRVHDAKIQTQQLLSCQQITAKDESLSTEGVLAASKAANLGVDWDTFARLQRL